jgi:hypothetical protein
MKTAQTLMAALRASHPFRPLSQHRCYREFLRLLPPRLRRAIAFVTVKNGQLMVALSHPGFKMELNYNQDVLKSLLRAWVRERPECRFMEAEKVVVFLSRHHSREEERDDSTIPRYHERAEGAFSLPEGDETLTRSFERIREWIRRNREACERR